MPTSERIALSGTKGLVSLVIAAALGVGGTIGGIKIASSQDTPSVVSEASAQVMDRDVENRVNARTDAEVLKARDDCRRELAAAQSAWKEVLGRIDSKLEKMSDDVGNIKTDVATLKATRRR